MVSFVALVVFPVLMAFAASSDLFTMRISNRLVLLLTAGFFVLALSAGMSWPDIGMHVASGAIVLVVAFTFFAMGWIGGGDAKFVAATSLWLGFGPMLEYLVFAALLGGALTLIILAVRRWPLPAKLAEQAWIDRLHDTKSGVPYGIALAIAGILVYQDTEIFQRFIA